MADLKNSAFVFVKPHAVTDAVTALVEETLKSKSLTILSKGSLTAEQIDKGMLIDQHYYAIASKATLRKPDQLPVPKDKFEAKFGVSWEKTLEDKKAFNAVDACAHLGISAEELNVAWGSAIKEKFGGGFYCGLVTIEGKEPVYVFNGFFMSMRSKFVAPGATISYFVVEWNPSDLSWADFRGKVLGPTNPADAPADSLRGVILAKWEELGLKSKPNTGDNGVHASASPFEGLAERTNWLSAKVEEDPYGSALVAAGISAETIKEWSVDPRVSWKAGDSVEQSSLFDALEDMDAADCLKKAVEINTGKQ
jgi:nucleoside diphosphate kinase